MAPSLRPSPSGVMDVGGLALQSTKTLYELIRSFQSQDKDARALKAEVSDLSEVLISLLDTVADHPDADFGNLELPLRRCSAACDEYRKIIERCTRHSSDDRTRSSVRDWITQRYLQGDINDFKAMLFAHKSTISIALANANLRMSAITPRVLEEYKDKIIDTATDLEEHKKSLQDKIDRLQAGDDTAVDEVAVEWDAMIQEKKSAQLGLDMCAQLSAQIARFEAASMAENTTFSNRPSAQKHFKKGLGELGGSVQSLVARLQGHEAAIDSQLEAMSLRDGPTSEIVAAQVARLQDVKESISHCIQIVSQAGEGVDQRSNVFEDITLADNSYAFTVSTVNELVTARRVQLKDRSRHVGGQVSDEFAQLSIRALTELDREHLRSAATNQNPIDDKNNKGKERDHERGEGDPPAPTTIDRSLFLERFGPGMQLANNRAG